MPIKGRSEIRRVPRVGKIHLGYKKQGQKDGENYEYPTATDYFVVRADDMTTSPEVAAAFKAVYGEQPKEIKIAFPSDDPEQFFPQYFTWYKGKTKKCQGDGEKASRLDDEGKLFDLDCLGEECPLYQKKQCKALARLQFFLPDVPGIGVWQIDTSSYFSTVNLNSAITMITALTGGRIKMIPLTLRLIPQVVSPLGKTKTVYVLDIKIEDIKLTDFLKQIPLLSAAFAPDVEPIRMDEVAEDLYVDQQGEEEKLQTDPQNDEDVYILKMFESKPNKHEKKVGRVEVVNRDGETVEALTMNEEIIEQVFPALVVGTKVFFQIKNSSSFKDRNELEFIIPA